MTFNGSESWEQLAVCPSFNSYSADRLANVARGVALEDEGQGRNSESEPTSSGNDLGGDYLEEAGDDDFEFVSLVREHDDVLINGGHTGPVFPVFNRDLLYVGDDRNLDGEAKEDRNRDHAVSSVRIPLKDLFVEDRDPPSSSSSEADELEGIPEGSYCVWTPKSPAESPLSPSHCKKSSSTGSCSKRWSFRDLLRRSNSDGKESFVFLTPASRSSSMSRSSDAKAGGGEAKEKAITPPDRAVAVVAERRNKAKASSGSGSASAHEVFYVRNRAMKEGDKRRSYLPYRQGLVGFFANVNGMGRTFPPF